MSMRCRYDLTRHFLDTLSRGLHVQHVPMVYNFVQIFQVLTFAIGTHVWSQLAIT